MLCFRSSWGAVMTRPPERSSSTATTCWSTLRRWDKGFSSSLCSAEVGWLKVKGVRRTRRRCPWRALLSWLRNEKTVNGQQHPRVLNNYTTRCGAWATDVHWTALVFIVSSTFLPLCLKSPPKPTFTVLYFSPLKVHLKEWIKTWAKSKFEIKGCILGLASRIHYRGCLISDKPPFYSIVWKKWQ